MPQWPEKAGAWTLICSSRPARVRSRVAGLEFIDSPGFDADEQRTAVLRITDHIVDLSDIVLVFFDARHPESGSMRMSGHA